MLPFVSARSTRGGSFAAAPAAPAGGASYEYDLDDDNGIDTTPIFHFDAAQKVYNTGTTLATDGESISGWGSRVGDYTIDQATASAQPTFEATSANFNGGKTVVFDGGDWLFKTPMLDAGTLTSPTTMFMVIHLESDDACTNYGGGADDTAGLWRMAAYGPRTEGSPTGEKWSYYTLGASGYTTAGPGGFGGATSSAGDWIICWNFDASGTDYFYASYGGGALGAVGKRRYAVNYSGSEDPDMNLFNIYFAIGSGYGGAYPMKAGGEFAEVIMFNETLSATVDGSDNLTGGETNTVFDYLKAKYDI